MFTVYNRCNAVVAATLSLRPQFSDLCHKDFSPHYLIKIHNMGVSTFACKLAVC